jgi:hypothetical protein
MSPKFVLDEVGGGVRNPGVVTEKVFTPLAREIGEFRPTIIDVDDTEVAPQVVTELLKSKYLERVEDGEALCHYIAFRLNGNLYMIIYERGVNGRIDLDEFVADELLGVVPKAILLDGGGLGMHEDEMVLKGSIYSLNLGRSGDENAFRTRREISEKLGIDYKHPMKV